MLPQMGPSIVIVTDGDEELARTETRRLAGLMWEHRREMTATTPHAAEAVRLAIEAGRRPAVLAHLGDNIGGGSAGDGTTLLAELVKQGATAFVAPLYDPDAVAEAFRVGVRGRFDLTVGGNSDGLHGKSGSYQRRGEVAL